MQTKRIVAIDPGHPSYFLNGEINWGTHSKDGLKEVVVNLEIANLLKTVLEQSGYKVVLTRTDNKTVVDNVKRIVIASRNKAQFILRLHCDQNRENDTLTHGVRIFFPPTEASKIYYQSKTAALLMQKAIVRGTHLMDGGIHDDRWAHIVPRLGMLVGSKEAELLDIPVVLVEMVDLDSIKDVNWIKSNKNKNLLVEALHQGVEDVFNKVIIF